MVFTRKDFLPMQGTIRNSRSGHFTIGAYEYKGEKVIIGGIYGNCTASDGPSAEIFAEYVEWHRELQSRMGSMHAIVAGDFNLKLDVERNYKPRSTIIVKNFMEEFNLNDAGGEMRMPTWRRPHLPKSRSRLDYVLHSAGLIKDHYATTWGRGDHAEILGIFQVGARKHFKTTLKDWVFATEDFLSKAPEVIKDVLLDHDEQYRNKSYADRDQYVRNRLPREYEMELNVVEKEEGIFHAHVLLIIINRIMTLQRRVQTEVISRGKEKLKRLNREIGEKYEEIDRLPEGDAREGSIMERLADLKEELRDYAENVEQAKRTRINNFYLDNMGKSKAASFAVTKEPRASRGVGKLIDAEAEITDKDEILNKLQDNFFSTVGQVFQPRRTLENFLMEHGVEMPALEEDEIMHMDKEFSRDEIKHAISSAKAGSAPGPSGQTIALYKYIFSEIPTIFCNAINELAFVPGLIHSPPFAWLRERKIVFIPKPGKEGNRVSNLRPLSLLESMYKIKTRILNERMAGIMERILYPHQHGFCRNRSIQTATVPVLEAIYDAEKHGRPLQLLSIDLKSAFDTISPQTIYEVMEMEKFPFLYVDAMQRLTATGTARVSVNDTLGPERDVVCGNGQGNPPSASTFNIGSDPVLRAANTVSDAYRYTFTNGNKLPTTGFADDHLHGLKINNSQQIVDILEVYRKYQEVSGLTVSLAKTAILGINTDPDLLQEVARLTGIQVVTEFRYLGVQIRTSYKESMRASYEAVYEGITTKCNRLYASRVDLFHRRQIIKTVVIPSYNHIFMSFGPCEEACKKIDGEIIKLFWNRKTAGEIKRGRRLVAKSRIDASYEMGGLKMDFTTEIANGLVLNGLQRLRQQGRTRDENKSFLFKLYNECLREANILNLGELFRIGGPKIWIKAGNKLANISPFFSCMCKAMAKMLELNENSSDGWMTANIAGHTAMHDLYRISAADGIMLENYGLTYVGQLFGKDDLTGRIMTGVDIEYPEDMTANYAGLIMKCKNLRSLLHGCRVTGGTALGSFIHITEGFKYSGLYRKLSRGARDASLPGPPSYFTRRKDGIPVPALDLFMTGYKNLFKMDIPSKTLENSYLVMNRQVWTNEKNFLSRDGGQGREQLDDSCKLCGIKENTMHLMFECENYSEPLWATTEYIIKETVRRVGNGEDSYNIRLHAFLIMYSVTTGVPSKHVKDIMILIQEIKRNIVYRRFKRETSNVGVTTFGRHRLLAHLSITVQKIQSLRKYQGKTNTFFDTMQTIIKDMM
jgi:hypothetical protein